MVHWPTLITYINCGAVGSIHVYMHVQKSHSNRNNWEGTKPKRRHLYCWALRILTLHLLFSDIKLLDRLRWVPELSWTPQQTCKHWAVEGTCTVTQCICYLFLYCLTSVFMDSHGKFWRTLHGLALEYTRVPILTPPVSVSSVTPVPMKGLCVQLPHQ